jgi:thioredoxin reductase
MQSDFEVVIIGGSYSGLAAAMALGRSLRNVLIIDGGKPCNRFTPRSHNFITHDGEVPAVISAKAKAQVLAYPTVQFVEGIVVSAAKTAAGFLITTAAGDIYTAKKLLIATGVKDILPEIKGLADCWGISAIHCPYCHGYEYRHKATGILANGDAAYHYAMLLNNLTDSLSIFTNEPHNLTIDQLNKLAKNNIAIFESEVQAVNHEAGYINEIILADGTQYELSALYVRPANAQQTDIPQTLGCVLNDIGYITTDMMQKTTVAGIYAAGDCCSPMRSVSNAVAQGNMAGAAINMELCAEQF